MLKLAAFSSGLGMLPPGVAAGKASGSGSAATNNGVVELGDFETGLDGWQTNGGNELSRVTDDEIPAGVVSGRHALAVEVNGDLFPMIESKKRLRNADFPNNPYLQMHVMAYAEETDSALHFRFRLHHTPAGGEGGGSGGRTTSEQSGGSAGSKDVNVEESEPIVVPQLRPRRVQWDVSDLSTDILENAKRLEIVWHLEDHEPSGGHRGKAQGEFDYRGLVVFDDIRLSESAPISEAQQSQQKKMDLHRDHGMIVDRVFEEQTKTLERGEIVFADGFTTRYAFEVLADDWFEYTIDGETFEIGGGS